MSRPLSPQPLSRSFCNMASCWWGTFRLIYCHKFCCSQAVAPPSSSFCFYSAQLFLFFGSCCENAHVFVVSITVCADFDLLPQLHTHTHTRVYCLCPRAFVCHSISNSLNQSVRHTVSLSVRLSVSLALSVSHCVNTLITGGKRCATHTHSCTYTHIHTHICCWESRLLLAIFCAARCPSPSPSAPSTYDFCASIGNFYAALTP